MDPNLVSPGSWSEHTVIFNHDGYAAVWGYYTDPKTGYEGYCLGLRWNGDSATEKGFPLSSGHPMWFVVPDELTLGMLQNILTLSIAYGEKAFEEKIRHAIKAFINIIP